MKSILLLLVLSTSYALANVGDSVTHSFSYMGSTGKILQKVTAFNSSSQTYSVENSTIMAAGTNTTIEDMTAEDIMTQAKASIILAHCAQIGGAREVVLGMDTCKLVSNEISNYGIKSLAESMNANIIWIGNIPVNGLVQATLESGISLQLSTYNWAK